jgi:signal peptidase II
MQAARGTSLSDADHRRPKASASARSRWFLAGIAATAYAVDVVSKQLAVNRLADGDVPVLGNVFVLRLTYNPGAAFSLGTEYTLALSCLAIAAVGVILWVSRRVGDLVWALALGLLLGGVAGNLTDRLVRDPGPMRGHVVDLFMVPHWPVFNVADICINLAAGLIVLQAVRGVSLDGNRERAAHQ